jgi:hypothetical protein
MTAGRAAGRVPLPLPSESAVSSRISIRALYLAVAGRENERENGTSLISEKGKRDITDIRSKRG